MTITIVCDILGEENNGTTIACMNLIRFLRAQGHTVRVVCADQDKAGNECFYVVPELNLYLLNPIVERNGVTLPRLDRSLLEDAIRDCDVVHTTFVLQLSHTAVKIAKAYNKPITSSFHCQAENVTAHFLCKDLDAINRGVYRACYQMVYQYSDIIHYPTQFIRDTFEAVVGPTNGRVISNGVNSMFTPGPAKRPAAQLCAHRISPRTGHTTGRAMTAPHDQKGGIPLGTFDRSRHPGCVPEAAVRAAV